MKSHLRRASLEGKGRIWIPVDILELLNQPFPKPVLPWDVLLCEIMHSFLVETVWLGLRSRLGEIPQSICRPHELLEIKTAFPDAWLSLI